MGLPQIGFRDEPFRVIIEGNTLRQRRLFQPGFNIAR